MRSKIQNIRLPIHGDQPMKVTLSLIGGDLSCDSACRRVWTGAVVS